MRAEATVGLVAMFGYIGKVFVLVSIVFYQCHFAQSNGSLDDKIFHILSLGRNGIDWKMSGTFPQVIDKFNGMSAELRMQIHLFKISPDEYNILDRQFAFHPAEQLEFYNHLMTAPQINGFADADKTFVFGTFESTHTDLQSKIDVELEKLVKTIYAGIGTNFLGKSFAAPGGSLVIDDEFAKSLRELERIPSGQTKKDLQLFFLTKDKTFQFNCNYQPVQFRSKLPEDIKDSLIKRINNGSTTYLRLMNEKKFYRTIKSNLEDLPKIYEALADVNDQSEMVIILGTSNNMQRAAIMIAKELGLNRGNACIHLEKSPEIGRSRRRMPIDAAYDKYIETSKRMRVAILVNDKEPVEFVGVVGTEDSNIDFIDDVYMLLNKHVTPGTCSFILRVGERAYPRYKSSLEELHRRLVLAYSEKVKTHDVSLAGYTPAFVIVTDDESYKQAMMIEEITFNASKKGLAYLVKQNITNGQSGSSESVQTLATIGNLSIDSDGEPEAKTPGMPIIDIFGEDDTLRIFEPQNDFEDRPDETVGEDGGPDLRLAPVAARAMQGAMRGQVPEQHQSQLLDTRPVVYLESVLGTAIQTAFDGFFGDQEGNGYVRMTIFWTGEDSEFLGDYYPPVEFEKKLFAHIREKLTQAKQKHADMAILVKYMETPQYRTAMLAERQTLQPILPDLLKAYKDKGGEQSSLVMIVVTHDGDSETRDTLLGKIREIAGKMGPASLLPLGDPRNIDSDSPANAVLHKYNKCLYKAIVKRGYDKPTKQIRMTVVTKYGPPREDITDLNGVENYMISHMANISPDYKDLFIPLTYLMSEEEYNSKILPNWDGLSKFCENLQNTWPLKDTPPVILFYTYDSTDEFDIEQTARIINNLSCCNKRPIEINKNGNLTNFANIMKSAFDTFVDMKAQIRLTLLTRYSTATQREIVHSFEHRKDLIGNLNKFFQSKMHAMKQKTLGLLFLVERPIYEILQFATRKQILDLHKRLYSALPQDISIQLIDFMIATYSGEPYYRFITAEEISKIKKEYASICIVHVDGYEEADDDTPQGINVRNAFNKSVEDIIREYFGPTVVQKSINMDEFNEDETDDLMDQLLNIPDETDDLMDELLNIPDDSSDEAKNRKRKADTASLSPPDAQNSKQPRIGS